MCIVGWLIGYASRVRKGLPSCTDNHRVERSHRLQTVEDDGVHVRDDLREHRKLVEREIEARWNDTWSVIDVSILEDVTLRWITGLLTMILGTRFLFLCFFFFLILFFDLIDGKGSVLILALVKIEEFEF